MIPGSRDANRHRIGNHGWVALRCLIVDDSAAFLEAAEAFLQREGVDVVGVATNSAEALRLVATLRPDVTLVDVDLGGESGFDLVEKIGSGGHAAPAILISTHSEEALARLIEATPALGFVPKTRLSAKAISDVLQGADAA